MDSLNVLKTSSSVQNHSTPALSSRSDPTRLHLPSHLSYPVVPVVLPPNPIPIFACRLVLRRTRLKEGSKG